MKREANFWALLNQHQKQVNNMQLVEQHCIDKKDPRYSVIDDVQRPVRHPGLRAFGI